MHFLKNIVYHNGTISMIDFEYSTVDDKPSFLENRICYKRSHRGDMNEYVDSVQKSLMTKGWEKMQSRMCGPDFKPDDPSSHKKHGGFMHDLGKAATEAYLGGSRKIWQNVSDFQIFDHDSKMAQINSKFVIVNEILFKIH